MIRTILNTSRLALASTIIGAGTYLPATAQLTLQSGAYGVMSRNLAKGQNGLAFPLIASDSFVGVAEGNAGSLLSFPAAEGNIGALFSAHTSYYVEVVTGPLEGERLDVDETATTALANSSIALDLGGTSCSTLNVLGADVLAGARCVMRPHVTLSRLQAMLSPGLVGDDKHNKADGVHIFEGGAYAWYFLKADGASWAQKGASFDFRHRIVPPDASIIVELRSGAKAWLHEGIVRANAFRKNLVAGTQAFATGYPVALSPVDLAAFADPAVPAAIRWTGHAGPGNADWFQLSALDPKPFNWYFLTADGMTWERVAQKTKATSLPFVEPTEAVLLYRNNPDPGYVILSPLNL